MVETIVAGGFATLVFGGMATTVVISVKDYVKKLKRKEVNTSN